jgi:hypothetical protein
MEELCGKKQKERAQKNKTTTGRDLLLFFFL